LNEDIKAFCDRLADAGFVALALDLYHGKTASTIPEAEVLRDESDSRYEQNLQEVAEATAWLSEKYSGETQGVTLIAFSLGVWYALERSNADPERILKVVVFYGTRDGDYSQSRASYLCHFAENDDYEPHENVEAMVQALQQAGRPVTTHIYPGTGHWFFEPSRSDAYNPDAAQLAWERTMTFLKQDAD
jgi:carboxymethylenebutenolidase